MAFKDDIPNWKSYSNCTYYMKDVPQTAYSELSGLIKKAANNGNELRKILNVMAEKIPCELTQNWTWDFLLYDIPEFVYALEKKVEKGRFPVFMDCVSLLAEIGKLTTDEINDYLEDNKIGYRGVLVSPHHVKWSALDVSETIEKLDKTQVFLPSISQQAVDEIRRAKKALEDTEDKRAIKDALRGCVSAMEAVIKELGHDNEIGNATKNLKAQGFWGCDEIVKEGNSIFNLMHRLYPDLRHGSTETSSLSLNEAEYWIGRILNYIQYLDRQQKLIG